MIRHYNNYDLMKSIAFILMVIDHIGYYFFPQFYFFRAIGRGSALIFALLFGVTNHKKNNKILIFALLTAVVIYYFERCIIPINILFNFYLAYFLLKPVENMYYNHVYLFNFILILLIPISFITNLFIEYGLFFVFLVFCGKLMAKEAKTLRDKSTAISILFLFFLYQVMNFGFGIINMLIVAAIFYIIFKNIYNFKIKDLEENKILLFISRHSLELYTIHILLFNIIFRLLLTL